MTLRVGWAVPEQRPRPTQGLTITPSGATKIARRGYVLDDAQAVYERSPKWIWQDERFAQDETGEVSVRPPRWRLIGRGPAGVILAVVIDLPKPDGSSEVVSIYEASPLDKSRYAEDARSRR